MSQYKQYVYHFQYPMNSIDVREITDKNIRDLEKILFLSKIGIRQSTDAIQNNKIATKLVREHFPEMLI